MASAAERAVEVVDDVLMRYDDLFDSIPADVVEALMADPDLLVDLAIEAGGLEQVPFVGFSDGERVALTDDVEEALALSAQWKTWRDGPFAVYRRREATDG